MKKLYCLSLFLLFTFQISASNIDSLQLILNNVKTDKQKVTLLQQIGETYKQKGDFPNAIITFNKAIDLNPDKLILLEIWYDIATAKARLQEYNEALEQCNRIIAEDSPDQKLLAKTYSLMSNLKLSLGETNESYELQYKSLQISETINDTLGLLLASYQIGTIHFYQNNYKLALKNYKKALFYAKNLQEEQHIYSSLGAIGSTYHRLGDLEASAKYNLQSLQLAKKLDYEVGIAYAAFNVGSDYYAMSKYDTAIVFFLQGLELQQKQQDKWGQSSSLRMLGEAYSALDDWENSIKYSEGALEVAQKIGATPQIMEGYQTLARIYEQNGDYQQANQYLNSFVTLKDSLVNEETIEKIEEVQTNYEVAQKERVLLKKTNELNKIYGYVLIGSLVMLLVISWMTYSRYRSEQENNSLLAQKNEKIRSQNQELRTKNEQIQQQNVKLEQSNQELRRFAFIASHDLKEPLRTIGSYSNLLTRRYKDKLDEDANDFLAFITSGASRMYRLLNEVLDYSKIDNNNLALESVVINESVEQVVINLQDLMEQKNAVVEVEILPTIKATQIHIKQLFHNLITNALKFNTTENAIVNIRSMDDEDNHILSVTDNGIGLDMIYKDKIFDMFQRLHGKEEYGGTGIGLAICKKIVNQYNGEIWVESKLGAGATFFISIPKNQN